MAEPEPERVGGTQATHEENSPSLSGSTVTVTPIDTPEIELPKDNNVLATEISLRPQRTEGFGQNVFARNKSTEQANLKAKDDHVFDQDNTLPRRETDLGKVRPVSGAHVDLGDSRPRRDRTNSGGEDVSYSRNSSRHGSQGSVDSLDDPSRPGSTKFNRPRTLSDDERDSISQGGVTGVRLRPTPEETSRVRNPGPVVQTTKGASTNDSVVGSGDAVKASEDPVKAPVEVFKIKLPTEPRDKRIRNSRPEGTGTLPDFQSTPGDSSAPSSPLRKGSGGDRVSSGGGDRSSSGGGDRSNSGGVGNRSRGGYHSRPAATAPPSSNRPTTGVEFLSLVKNLPSGANSGPGGPPSLPPGLYPPTLQPPPGLYPTGIRGNSSEGQAILSLINGGHQNTSPPSVPPRAGNTFEFSLAPSLSRAPIEKASPAFAPTPDYVKKTMRRATSQAPPSYLGNDESVKSEPSYNQKKKEFLQKQFNNDSDSVVVSEDWENQVELPCVSAVPVVSEPTESTLTVSWNSPDNDIFASSYYVEMALVHALQLTPAETDFKLVNHAPTTKAVVTGLAPGTWYVFRVQPCVGADKGPLTPTTRPFRTLPAIPTAPLLPILQGKTRNSLSVAWSPPLFNGGSEVAGYRVMSDGDDRALEVSQFSEIYFGNERKFKHAKLKPGHCYRYAIAALNISGMGPLSEVVSFETGAAAPNRPLPPTLEKSSVSSIMVSWVAPPCNGAAITEYRLESDDLVSGYGFRAIYSGPNLSFLAQNLERVHEYRFRLIASNSEGESKPSPDVVYSTAAALPATPVLTFAVRTSTSITVTITHTDDGGAAILGYLVEVDQGFDTPIDSTSPPGVPPVPVFKTAYQGDGSNKRVVVPGLQAGKTYRFRVNCCNESGNSKFSEPLTISTSPGVPDPCPAPVAKPSSPKLKTSTVMIKWSAPAQQNGAAVTSYRLELAIAEPDHGDRKWVEAYTGPMMEYCLTGCPPNNPYSIRVFAKNNAGMSPPSEECQYRTAADVPNSPVLTVVPGNTSLSASWVPPIDNGSPITQYRLEVTPAVSAGSQPAGSTLDTTGVSLDVPGLKPNTDYLVRVLASNKLGAGEYSAVQTVRTAAGPPSAPAKPTLMSTTSNTLSISWSAAVPQGSDVTGYVVDVDGVSVRTPGDVLEFTCANLLSHKEYRVRVQAVSKAGSSPFSPSLVARTKMVPPPVPIFEVAGVTHNCIKLKWTYPSGGLEYGGVKSSELEMKKDGDTNEFFSIFHDAGLAFKVQQLTPDTKYIFRVRGSNEAGTGEKFAHLECATLDLPLDIPGAMKIRLHSQGVARADVIFPKTALTVQQASTVGPAVLLEVQMRLVVSDESSTLVTVIPGHGEVDDTLAAHTPDLTRIFRQVYCGLDATFIAVQGLQNGLQYEVRSRFRRESSVAGGTLGNFSAVSIFALPAPVSATSVSSDTKKSASEINKLSGNKSPTEEVKTSILTKGAAIAQKNAHARKHASWMPVLSRSLQRNISVSLCILGMIALLVLYARQ